MILSQAIHLMWWRIRMRVWWKRRRRSNRMVVIILIIIIIRTPIS